MLRIVHDEATSGELSLTLDEIAREGVRRLLALALDAEVEDYLARTTEHRDAGGRALVTRNGRAR